jgi:replicative DNA helicase
MATDTQFMLGSADDVERSILGGILLDNQHFYELQPELKSEYFGSDGHRRIYAAMHRMAAAGTSVDIVTLAAELERRKEIEAVGGIAYISSLIDGVPERPSLVHYVQIVKDRYRRRSLSVICDSAIGLANDITTPTDETLAKLERSLLRLRGTEAEQSVSSIRDIVPEVLNEMEAIRSMCGRTIGLTTGLESLDIDTTGIREDEYWVIGAMPSRGKTVLGVQMAAANAKKGIPVLFFSHEMTRRQLVRRMLPSESGISADKVRDSRLASKEEYQRIQESAANLAQWPMWVVDPDSLTAEELVAIAKLHIRRHGVRLIIVDYLQLVKAPGKEIKDQVTAVSNALRSIPKNERVPMVALSQLRRPTDGKENSRPSMVQLRETGYIEAHAHVILLLYRPKKVNRWTGADEIIIARQREGLVGYEPVFLHGGKLQFVERDASVPKSAEDMGA